MTALALVAFRRLDCRGFRVAWPPRAGGDGALPRGWRLSARMEGSEGANTCWMMNTGARGKHALGRAINSVQP
ncbi:hypothetical protein [Ralstonia pseudosolanacearum]|uniref:hypothetical protein n=1 Tax=Ralstonia pseudosolanacearum TaxID=1310165 RepID=UPI00322192F1